MEFGNGDSNVGAAYGTISDVTVYLFSENGSYLGIKALTDATGKVTFNLPAGCRYKLRYDILGTQYWSNVFTVTEGVQNNLILNAGGGTLQVNILKAAGYPLTGARRLSENAILKSLLLSEKFPI